MSADADPTDPTNEAPNASSTAAASRADARSPAAAGSDPTGVGGSVFDRVLVVTDDGPAGRAAAATGVELAVTHGAAVDALYVVDTATDWDVVVERRERTGEDLVESVEERGAAAGVDVEKWFRYGAAHEEAIDFAAAHDADLIVVGSARRTGLDRLIHPDPLPGRLQRGADAPVLVVGPDDD
ncbi:universal stress protein [Halorubrum tebenquichense]|uniref:Universal stress protein n=1 Tax=Halorubrum tebenquichense DSM 14210 TaxID=1227485 RepID=M0DZ98_9EURY|nr:universal stress protein [Halorubrum tebenquichense]ELZ40841.1 universal stress protein [Halorubrum tebenquichense DSM 14210]